MERLGPTDSLYNSLLPFLPSSFLIIIFIIFNTIITIMIIAQLLTVSIHAHGPFVQIILIPISEALFFVVKLNLILDFPLKPPKYFRVTNPIPVLPETDLGPRHPSLFTSYNPECITVEWIVQGFNVDVISSGTVLNFIRFFMVVGPAAQESVAF